MTTTVRLTATEVELIAAARNGLPALAAATADAAARRAQLRSPTYARFAARDSMAPASLKIAMVAAATGSLFRVDLSSQRILYCVRII